MKILLDEGLPRRDGALLREAGIDTVHVTESLGASTADVAILESARADDRVVVTLDADLTEGVALSVRGHLVGIRKLPFSGEVDEPENDDS